MRGSLKSLIYTSRRICKVCIVKRNRCASLRHIYTSLFMFEEWILEKQQTWDSPATKESSTGLSSLLSANASSANCSGFSRTRSDPPVPRVVGTATERPAIKRIRESVEDSGLPEQVSPRVRRVFFLSVPGSSLSPLESYLRRDRASWFTIRDTRPHVSRLLQLGPHIRLIFSYTCETSLAKSFRFRGIFDEGDYVRCARFNERVEATREIQRKLSRANCTVAIRL